MFIIGIILIFRGVYNRPPQKSEACTMAWPIVKIAVGATQNLYGYGALKEKKRIFQEPIEKELADHVKELSKRFYGITATNCRQLAYELAKKIT